MRFLKLGAVILCAILLKRFCYQKTDGFALYKIQSQLSFHPEWEVDCTQENLDTLLDQRYHYLAKGAQSYVFASEDGKTVIKFFRIYHLTPPLWVTGLSLPIYLQHVRIRKMIEKGEELAKDFESYAIAYNEMKEETGLLYLHLNKTHHLRKKLTIVDKIGIAHAIDLDKTEFLVQKKAKLIFPSIEQLVREESIDAAKQAVSNLVQLLVCRCEKGLLDKDPDLNTNFGFIGTTPVQIDIGRFRRQDDTQISRDEIFRITDNFRQWLDQKYPSLSEHLQQEIRKIP